MLTIRTLAAEEAASLIGWAGEEGWNPGLADASAFHATDPQGFLGGFLDGEMVSGISGIAYGDDFGFIGLYICRPDMRGRGYGKAVWDAAMARLDGRTIGLDGVPEQQANYRSMGFEPVYRTIRYSGRTAAPALPHGTASPVAASQLPALEQYDRICFPAVRTSFLQRWIAPPRLALAIIREGEMAGYGVVRTCREGAKIGPLFADGDDDAAALFSALAGQAEGPVHIDVPENQVAFTALLSAYGLVPGFETARMYRGTPPKIDARRVFGITTLELG